MPEPSARPSRRRPRPPRARFSGPRSGGDDEGGLRGSCLAGFTITRGREPVSRLGAAGDPRRSGAARHLAERQRLEHPADRPHSAAGIRRNGSASRGFRVDHAAAEAAHALDPRHGLGCNAVFDLHAREDSANSENLRGSAGYTTVFTPADSRRASPPRRGRSGRSAPAPSRRRVLRGETLPELHDEMVAVEVSFEVEEERLDPALLPAVVRVDADRDRSPMLADQAGVDPVGRDDLRRHGEVRRRIPQRPARASPETTVPSTSCGRPSIRAAASTSPAPTSCRIRLEEMPSTSGTGRTSKPSSRSVSKSPDRPRPKRKFAPATTRPSAPSGLRITSANCSGVASTTGGELHDDDLDPMSEVEQLHAALGGGEQLDLVAERDSRVRVEGQRPSSAVPRPARLR